jgi:Protein of unknown function (DUF2591)
MKKIDLTQSSAKQLDWLVATCLGLGLHKDELLGGHIKQGWWVSGLNPADLNDWTPLSQYQSTTNLAVFGPILKAERIGIEPWGPDRTWLAQIYNDAGRVLFRQYGDEPFVAAMRCYVASELGDEVDVPDDLCAEDELVECAPGLERPRG